MPAVVVNGHKAPTSHHHHGRHHGGRHHGDPNKPSNPVPGPKPDTTPGKPDPPITDPNGNGGSEGPPITQPTPDTGTTLPSGTDTSGGKPMQNGGFTDDGYQHNTIDIKFNVPGGYTLEQASFTVTDLVFADYHDPEPRNHIGDTKQWSGTFGCIDFEFRRSEAQVAKWWNEKLGGGKNSFNKDAAYLTCAFKGDLQMKVSGGALGLGSSTYDIKNIGLAQGYDGTDQIWWFGGDGCEYQAELGDVLKVPAYSHSGWHVDFCFRRGAGTAGNVIDCINLAIPGFELFPLADEFFGECAELTTGWANRRFGPKMAPYMVYLESEDAEKLKLGVLDGKLVIWDEDRYRPFDTTGADTTEFSKGQPTAIYVISADGQIYASRQNKVGLFQHSSILNSQAVAGAGEMTVVNGVIQTANNASGHFRIPGATAMKQLEESLERQEYKANFSWISYDEDDLRRAYFLS
jgi:hypothetical protein